MIEILRINNRFKNRRHTLPIPTSTFSIRFVRFRNAKPHTRKTLKSSNAFRTIRFWDFAIECCAMGPCSCVCIGIDIKNDWIVWQRPVLFNLPRKTFYRSIVQVNVCGWRWMGVSGENDTADWRAVSCHGHDHFNTSEADNTCLSNRYKTEESRNEEEKPKCTNNNNCQASAVQNCTMYYMAMEIGKDDLVCVCVCWLSVVDWIESCNSMDRRVSTPIHELNLLFESKVQQTSDVGVRLCVCLFSALLMHEAIVKASSNACLFIFIIATPSPPPARSPACVHEALSATVH